MGIKEQFRENYTETWGEDFGVNLLTQLVAREIEVEEGFKKYLKSAPYVNTEKHDVEWFKAYVIRIVRMCLNKMKNVYFDEEGFLIILPKIEKIKPIKKSNRCLFREEVLIKLQNGEKNFEDTKINICKRDRYNILRELKLEPHIKDTNYVKNHLDWKNCETLYKKIKESDWTKARAYRAIKKELNYDVSVTTLRYKEREFGVLTPKYEEWENYLHLKKEESEIGREKVLENNDLIVDNNDLDYLLCNYSFSEIAYIKNTPLHKIISTYKNSDSLQKNQIPFINNYNLQQVYYYIDLDNMDKELQIYNNDYFVKKYKVGYSTISALRKNRGLNLLDICKELFKECTTEEECDSKLLLAKSKEWYAYHEKNIKTQYKLAKKRIYREKYNYIDSRQYMISIEDMKRKSLACKHLWILGYSMKAICSRMKVYKRDLRLLLPKEGFRERVEERLLKESKRICYRCHNIRDLSHFHKKCGESEEYRTQCKDCRRETKWKSSVKSKDIQLMYEFFDYKCAYCGKELDGNSIALDHITPSSRGGEDVIDNLVISCLDCNSVIKGAKTLSELTFDSYFTRERKDKILHWIEKAKNI